MTANIDWKNLGFAYHDTGSYVKAEFKDGKWSGPRECSDPFLPLHVAATALHYGQACFEGLKVFSRKDGSVAAFRPEENARRLIDSARRLVMEPPPEELFLESLRMVVGNNRDYIPPYGTGASLYVRPLLIGSSPHVGLHPSEEYMLITLAMPVGPYYKDGFFPVKAYVQEDIDRAAPHGVGNIKAAGNYAAGMCGDIDGKQKGYPICLYLDSASHTFIDEFGTSNFFGITADGTYMTPDSRSVLPSITNKSLQAIAVDLGMKAVTCPIPVNELGKFTEVGACGTAAVITPVCTITHGKKVYTFGSEDKAGETLSRLFREIQGIQYGELDDRHGWMMQIT